ncbi:MAG: Hsp20 family protein [Pseudomonadota bacterium]
MKKLITILSTLILVGLGNSLQAEWPDRYGPGYYQRPPLPSSAGYRQQGRMHIEKGMNEEGYQLRIHASGDINPESIHVGIQGNSILIENDQSLQREERNEGGYYSYSRSSRNFRRRISIPRNADIENMQRSVEAGVITITLPFLNGYRY